MFEDSWWFRFEECTSILCVRVAVLTLQITISHGSKAVITKQRSSALNYQLVALEMKRKTPSLRLIIGYHLLTVNKTTPRKLWIAVYKTPCCAWKQIEWKEIREKRRPHVEMKTVRRGLVNCKMQPGLTHCVFLELEWLLLIGDDS